MGDGDLMGDGMDDGVEVRVFGGFDRWNPMDTQQIVIQGSDNMLFTIIVFPTAMDETSESDCARDITNKSPSFQNSMLSLMDSHAPFVPYGLSMEIH